MPLSAEEKAKLDEVKGELLADVQPLIDKGVADTQTLIGGINAQVESLKTWMEEQKAKAGVSVPGVDEGKEKFSFAKAAFAMSRKDWRNAQYEKEVIDATIAKAQTVGVVADGGALVPNEIAKDIIDRLRPMSVLMQSGMTEMNFSGIGKYEMPRLVNSSQATWLGELEPIAETGVTFDRVTLDPKKVAAMITASRELLADANQSVEAIIRNDLAKQIALAIDIKGLMGTGAAGTPKGVLNTSGINTYAVGANGDKPSWHTFDQLIALLEDSDALTGSLKFISNPRVFRALREQTVAEFSGQLPEDGSPIITPIISDQKLRDMLGYDFLSTTQIPKNGTKGTGTNLSKLFFGDWSQLIMGRWGALELDASDTAGNNFQNYSVQIRAVARCDFGVRQAKAFAVATDIGTSF